MTGQRGEAPWPEQMRRANAPLSDEQRRELEVGLRAWLATPPGTPERHAAGGAFLAIAQRQVAG